MILFSKTIFPIEKMLEKLHTNYLHIFGLIHSNFNIHFLSYCWKLRFQKKIKGPVKTWLSWTNINGVQLWIVAFAIVLHKVVIIRGLHLQQFVKNGNLLKTKSPYSRRKCCLLPKSRLLICFSLKQVRGTTADFISKSWMRS